MPVRMDNDYLNGNLFSSDLVHKNKGTDLFLMVNIFPLDPNFVKLSQIKRCLLST